MSESTTFYLVLYSTNLNRRAARIMNDLVNLSAISTEYHKFVNIFSKVKAETLALHHLYELQIKLEDEKNHLLELSTHSQLLNKKFSRN